MNKDYIALNLFGSVSEKELKNVYGGKKGTWVDFLKGIKGMLK